MKKSILFSAYLLPIGAFFFVASVMSAPKKMTVYNGSQDDISIWISSEGQLQPVEGVPSWVVSKDKATEIKTKQSFEIKQDEAAKYRIYVATENILLVGNGGFSLASAQRVGFYVAPHQGKVRNAYSEAFVKKYGGYAGYFMKTYEGLAELKAATGR